MRRFVFAPSWVFGHFVILIAVISCMLLARWQWDVSQHTHSLQNLAYALQWPLFGVFFAVMWYRMLRLESEKLDEESVEYEPDSEEPDSEEPEPPEPNDAAAGANGAVVVDADRRDAARHAERGRSQPPVSAPLLSPPPASRAAASMKSDREPDLEPDDEDDRDELAAYNRMLAELAVRDQSH